MLSRKLSGNGLVGSLFCHAHADGRALGALTKVGFATNRYETQQANISDLAREEPVAHIITWFVTY